MREDSARSLIEQLQRNKMVRLELPFVLIAVELLADRWRGMRTYRLPEHAWHRQAHGYSKGMRQKVGIVMALAKGAKVLVLDEPTSGLDPEASVTFGALIRALADDGAAVIMATHDLLRAQELADRCGMLVGGRLISEWNLRDLAAGELERTYLESLGHARRA